MSSIELIIHSEATLKEAEEEEKAMMDAVQKAYAKCALPKDSLEAIRSVCVDSAPSLSKVLQASGVTNGPIKIQWEAAHVHGPLLVIPGAHVTGKGLHEFVRRLVSLWASPQHSGVTVYDNMNYAHHGGVSQWRMSFAAPDGAADMLQLWEAQAKAEKAAKAAAEARAQVASLELLVATKGNNRGKRKGGPVNIQGAAEKHQKE